MDAVCIKNLLFKYDEKVIFNKLNLNILQGTFNTIIGLNGSGKSTLVRLLLGFYEYTGNIQINGLELCKDNIKDIRKSIGVVLENPDNQFVAETVMDDIAFTLENMNMDPKTIRTKVKEIANKLGIDNLLQKEPHSLSGGQKQLVALASALVHDPKILMLDEALTMVSIQERTKVYDLLLKLNKNNNMTIINITHDADELIYGDNIIVINDGKIMMQGSKESVLVKEKEFQKIGLELPFMASLSIKLKYYGLIDRLILNADEMVDEIWK